MKAIRLLVDSNQGVYVPKTFATHCKEWGWQGVSDEDLACLIEGPIPDLYWETWDDVLGKAFLMDGDKRYTLHQDGDLWAVCGDLMSNEEYANFFNDMKPAPGDAYEYAVCDQCLQALANDCWDNTSPLEEQCIRNGLQDLQSKYKSVVADGADYGFCWSKCECCGGLPGNRFRFICMDRIEEAVVV